MASTYSTNLAIELIGTGEQSGTWGVTTNSNLGTLIEQAISGYVTQAITDGAATVITIPNGATGVARNMFIECTGALTAARVLEVPANKKLYFIYNNTTGGYAVTVKVSGQTGVSVPNGKKVVLVSNGTDIVEAFNTIVSGATINGISTYSVRGLQGVNNSGTPNTQYDVVANEVVLINSSTGAPVRRTNTGTITNNVATAGPTANGRDQAGAFSADSWVHFYFIWNGATLATVSSATAPPTGPTLPSGYTHWAYIGAVYFPSSALRKTYIRGSLATHADITLSQTTTFGSEINFSTATCCPANALSIICSAAPNVTPTGSTPGVVSPSFGVTTGVYLFGNNFSVDINNSTWYSPIIPRETPNTAAQLIYLLSVLTNCSGGFNYFFAHGYRIPNGGE